jgi:hypothetical protein
MELVAYLAAHLAQSMRDVMAWLMAHPLELVLLVLLELAWVAGVFLFARRAE